MTKVLIFGANGQLGKTLISNIPKGINLEAYSKDECDFLNVNTCIKRLNIFKPQYVINASAYTNVDKAEEDHKTAYQVNGHALENITKCIANNNGTLLHISTDFVFNGEKSLAYKPKDPINPIGVYGKSKALGEKYVLKMKNNIVIRTSWLYSPFGGNFMTTMLRLHKDFSEKNIPLKVVSDQISCPTSTYSLAEFCWKLIINNSLLNNESQLFHWSDSGVASWYDFAFSIGELGIKYGLLEKMANTVPIKSYEFPSAVKRPHFSLLDNSNSVSMFQKIPLHWRDELSNNLRNLKLNLKNLKI